VSATGWFQLLVAGVAQGAIFSPEDHIGIHAGLAQWKIVNGGFEFIRDLNAAK
jgi:hypothetical protein